MNRTIAFGEMSKKQRAKVIEMESAGWSLEKLDVRYAQLTNEEEMRSVKIDTMGKVK